MGGRRAYINISSGRMWDSRVDKNICRFSEERMKELGNVGKDGAGEPACICRRRVFMPVIKTPVCARMGCARKSLSLVCARPPQISRMWSRRVPVPSGTESQSQEKENLAKLRCEAPGDRYSEMM
jgi:hypothetical protein